MTAASAISHDLFAQASTSYRLEHKGLMVDGVPFNIQRYRYLREIIDGAAPVTTILKGAQMGFTVACILRCLENQLTEPLRGSLYLFPTDDEVQDFSKARFAPMMRQAAYSHLQSAVDTAGLKEVGRGYIYFRGAGQRGGSKQKSKSKLKSMPIDRLYLDEYDEMAPDRVDAAEHRLDGSPEWLAQRIGLSTPTLPEYGVDLDFKLSDMRSWFWRCARCNGWTCLEETWPDCIAEPSEGEAHYLCSKCGGLLERVVGQWVAAKPDRSREHRGFYISQLSSLVRSAGHILRDLAAAERKGRMKEFTNQVLARPYADISDALTDALLNACLDRERPRARRAKGPCAMGVDPGSKLIHYVVGDRVTATDSRIYDWGRVEGFDEIAAIARKFNVQVGVMDIGAETRMVRSFLKSHPGWWGCQYVEKRKAGYDWNHREQILTVDRTEALDESHHAIINRNVSFPAPDERYHELVAPQMKNLARATLENEETGDKRHRWVVTGGVKNDHIKHAHTYFQLALERVGLADDVRRAQESRQAPRRPRSAMTI